MEQNGYNYEKDARIEEAAQRCEACRQRGFHCPESAIRAYSETLGLRLSDDILRMASGFRGGGGGYGDRCGVLEAGCMLIGYLYGRLTPEQKTWDYSALIYTLHERFRDRLGSTSCRDLKPAAKQRDGNCGSVYQEGARIVTQLLLEAEALLAAVPPEARRD